MIGNQRQRARSNCLHQAEWSGSAGRLVNIPNLITLGRVILVPFVIWLIINDRYIEAFAVFLVAGISDGVDGFLAKRFGWQTELGAYLDPLADKLMLVSLFVTLGIKGELPSWIVIGAVSRDILIVMGVLLAGLLGRPLKVRPYVISKLNTLAQITLVAVTLADEAFKLGLGPLRIVLLWTTAFLIIASLATYVRAWMRHMAGYDTGQDEPASKS
jgi:cardiolipin synthase (CMP-forming)